MRSDRAAQEPRRDALAPGSGALAQAARAVAAVAFAGRNTQDALGGTGGADHSAIRAITLGTLRWYLRLAPAIAHLVARPMDSLQRDVRALLIVAAHQIEYSRHAPELTVNAAVDASRALGQARASGFVNA